MRLSTVGNAQRSARSPRGRKAAFFTVSVLLVLGIGGCEKKKDDNAQGGEIDETATTTGVTVPAGPTTTGDVPWSGTVTTAYSYTYESSNGGGQLLSNLTRAIQDAGSITYTDLVSPGSTADLSRTTEITKTAEYSAVVAGGGSAEVERDCFGLGWEMASYPWTVAGRDNAGVLGTPETSGSLEIIDVYDRKTGALQGTRIWPEGLTTWVPYCDEADKDFLTVGRYDLTPLGGEDLMSALMPDDDPDPDHLAGSVTYTLASPPYPLVGAPVEYSYTITYDLRRQARDCGTDPGKDPVFCYAPLVRLHPDEITFPMDIGEFVSSSRLMWNRDHGCDDEVVAEVIDPARLGRKAADPYTAQEAGWPGCDPSGHRFTANELTKPGQEGKAHGLDKEEGFYLDLADDRRLGAVPTDGKVRTGAYYSLSEDGRHITYWFMYGFNQGAPGTGTYVDHHEGEWERVTVDLASDGTAEQVRYWQHECTEPETVSYDEVEKEDTHPVVYSALGSHASFPDVRYVDNDGVCPLIDALGIGQGWGDATARGGYQWETWATSLRDAADQPWYGFGGAWGEVGGNEKRGDPCLTAEDVVSGRAPCLTDVTGPLGPDHKNLFSYP